MPIRERSQRADTNVPTGVTGSGCGQRPSCNAASRGGFRRFFVTAAVATVIATLLILAPSTDASARVLTEADFQRIAEIRTSFTTVMHDLAKSAQRTDLAAGDADCIKLTMRDLLTLSNELSSYEHLITIENQISDFGDDEAMKGILLFAVENATKMLDIEYARLTQLSEQCSSYPTSVRQTRQAMAFIEKTRALLNSIRPRL